MRSCGERTRNAAAATEPTSSPAPARRHADRPRGTGSPDLCTSAGDRQGAVSPHLTAPCASLRASAITEREKTPSPAGRPSCHPSAWQNHWAALWSRRWRRGLLAVRSIGHRDATDIWGCSQWAARKALGNAPNAVQNAGQSRCKQPRPPQAKALPGAKHLANSHASTSGYSQMSAHHTCSLASLSVITKLSSEARAAIT
jgi:hypothetical protein